MARITVEDCLQRTPDRFTLVLLAAQRARALAAGAKLLVERDNDKNSVVALREIAEGGLDLDEIRETRISRMRQRVEIETPAGDPEILAEIAGNQAEVAGAVEEEAEGTVEIIDAADAPETDAFGEVA